MHICCQTHFGQVDNQVLKQTILNIDDGPDGDALVVV